jgi:TetR/AcrR family transcriptional regulator, transcriptional repressor for nem operon
MNTRAAQKARSHEVILQSAARLLREQGIGGTGVVEVMRGAGLTAGGFYAHFDSKQSLVDQALRRTGQELRRRLFAGLDHTPEPDRALVVVRRYLSPEHRDQPAEGCPLPATVAEVATSAPQHRSTLAHELTAFAEQLRTAQPAGPARASGDTALGLIALMYGGLALSRAVAGTPLSDEILQGCQALARSALQHPAGAPPSQPDAAPPRGLEGQEGASDTGRQVEG